MAVVFLLGLVLLLRTRTIPRHPSIHLSIYPEPRGGISEPELIELARTFGLRS